MVKVTFEKRIKIEERQRHKKENENSWQRPARPEQQQQEQRADPVALVKGHRAATGGQAAGMQGQLLGIAQVKAPRALPSSPRKHLKSS